MDSSDTLRIDLGGTDPGSTYDQVTVNESAQFDGTLSVQVIKGFDPDVGTTFHVVSSVGSTGAFTELNLPELAEGKRLVPVLPPDGLTLVVADPERPTGDSQLRLPENAVTEQLTSFLGGFDTTVSYTDLDLTVLGQNIRGDFTFGVGLLDNAPIITASATKVSASLGGDLVTLQNGSGSFFLTQSGVAGQASVEVVLKDDLPVTFSGTFGFALNTTSAAVNGTVGDASVNVPAGPYFRAAATGASFTAAGQQVSGDFLLETTTITENTLPVEIVRAAAKKVHVLLGTEQAGVEIENGQGGFLIRPEGIAAQFSGDVALVGASDEFALSGAVAVRMNNTGKAVEKTFTLSNGETVVIDFSDTDTDQVVEFGGALKLQVSDFLSVEGAYAIRSRARWRARLRPCTSAYRE